jgi:DeoR/GlpR family transcriptional regulator of sugar metabolism
MGQAKVNYPVDSTFGRRIQDIASEKEQVAKFVVNKFLTQGAAVFICDGSSTFYVGLEIFQEAKRRLDNSEEPLDISIYTNNLAIAHEYALWNSPQGRLPGVRVYSTGGEICADLMMEAGDRARDMAAESSQRGPYVVLAVRAIFAREGPAGLRHDQDVIIKRALLQAGEGIVQGVILVADYKKLSQPYKLGMPILFNDSKNWTNLMEKTNTYIVSTRNPQHEGKSPPGQGQHFSNPQTEEECYLVNCTQLAHIMNKDINNKRFILL